MPIIGALFFTVGFVTCLNGPPITFVKLAFGLDDRNAFLVPFAFYRPHFFFALPRALLPWRTGMRRGIAGGPLCGGLHGHRIDGFVTRPRRGHYRIHA
jgi:FHS family L-fucose permease-like MFS transporter